MLSRLKLLIVFPLWIITTVVGDDDFIINDALINDVRRHYGKAASERMIRWQGLLQGSLNLTEMQKLAVVNDFFNEQRFIDDIDHWGKDDFWATPVEFLGSGGGDCEDFSIAKYYTLRQLGIPDKKLRVTYVMALEYKQAHMVLSYYSEPDTEPLILDNLNKRILPASERRDLKPVYNFNGDGLWYARQQGNSGKRIGKSSRVGRWTKLRNRFQQSIANSQEE